MRIAAALAQYTGRRLPQGVLMRIERRHIMRTFLLLFAVACTLISGLAAAGDADLARAFANPPAEAWPWVYWFWSDGNMTREGITADLEAMRRVGIRGVLIMEVDQGIPKGPVRFLSPRWRELFQFVLRETSRLGIEVSMNNDGGWCGSGGPWVKPQQSMQMVVWNETAVLGPRRFESTLAQPKTTRDYYRDIAVLAVPEAPGAPMSDAGARLSLGAGGQAFDAARLLDGNPGTVAVLPLAKPGEPQYLNIDFPHPFTARGLSIALDPWQSTIACALEVSDDGQHFKATRSFTASWPASSVNFEAVSARHYRIAFTPVAGSFETGIPLGEVELHPDARIEGIPGKAAYVGQMAYAAVPGPPLPSGMVVQRSRILDITANMGVNGKLKWDAPPGRWRILRFGTTTTGKTNHPAPAESVGLECDKLSKEAVEAHFAGLMGNLVQEQRALGLKAMTFVHIDSWEVGSQNWTPQFREEFRRRRGYDLLPYLPVVTGRVVENQDVSERFLWDLRRTVSDMITENYVGHMRQLSNQHGLKLSVEGYGSPGDEPLDHIPYAGRADMPMTEFWMGGEPMTINKEMASAGHIYGHPIIGAESFTAFPEVGKWQNHPFRMKALGDLMFTQGVNRFIFHRYAMQPWMNVRPGMTMGQWGIHFERTNTWWEQSKAWLAYLARCQYLLQKGQFVADVAYLSSEKAPNDNAGLATMKSLSPAMPAGYDYDFVTPEILLSQATVEDGSLKLASGMSYRILVLPEGRWMRPALLRKIRELVYSGATVVGPPPSSSPGLTSYGEADAEVRRLAAELWGDCDGASIREHKVGKGRVVWGQPLVIVLRESGRRTDFYVRAQGSGQEAAYIHRTIGGNEVYFVANTRAEAATLLCGFRVARRRPELWWPDTGRIERTAVYEQQGPGTRLPIRLEPFGSVFVVFGPEPASTAENVAAVIRNGVEISGMLATAATDLRDTPGVVRVEHLAEGRYMVEASLPGSYQLKTGDGRRTKFEIQALPEPIRIDGAWEVGFTPGLGAPERTRFEKLLSWTEHADAGVRYFSGTGTYRRQIEIPAAMLDAGRRLYLDLGRVQVIAEVRLNGRDLGILWKPPFRVDITEAAHGGRNELEVKVVNLWPNRLIGDEQLPEDTERDGPKVRLWPQWMLDGKPSPTGRVTFSTWKHWTKDDPLLESGLLGPVMLVGAQRVAVGR